MSMFSAEYRAIQSPGIFCGHTVISTEGKTVVKKIPAFAPPRPHPLPPAPPRTILNHKEAPMLLELGKAFSFFASLLSLYPVVLNAFFVPDTRWQERLFLAFSKLVIAGCICFASGLLFTWPARSNPTANQALTDTLPIRLFLWTAPALTALFLLSWYLVCASPTCITRACT
jgi:hypothetical protein